MICDIAFDIRAIFHKIKKLHIDFCRKLANGHSDSIIHLDNCSSIRLDKTQRYATIAKLSKLEELNIKNDENFSDELLKKLVTLKTFVIKNGPKITNIVHKILSKIIKYITLNSFF